MRSAVLSRSAIAQRLMVLAGGAIDQLALDMRANACGLGVAEVSSIARDLGFRYALHSPETAKESTLTPSPSGLKVLSGWWSGATEPIMTLCATVISVKRVKAGSRVSYGYRYTTARETTLALVSAGFADGVPRSASGNAHVVLGEHTAVLAGQIAMDQCIADCGDAPVAVGDEVVLWGRNPSLSQWSTWSGRTEGALLSHIGDRVAKTWV